MIYSYTLVKNEEKMLPFYLNHYSQIADKMVIYDSGSTDRTIEIAKSNPKVEVREFKMDGWDDIALTDLYNSCWKESRGKADWVIMLSVDEILYYPDWKKYLDYCKEQGITVPTTTGFTMLAEDESVYEHLEDYKDQQIYDFIKTGVYHANDSKLCIFNPEIDINYKTGCHQAVPTGNVKFDSPAIFKMLHYSLRGLKGSLEKNRLYRETMSQTNKDLNLGFHRLDDGFFLSECYYPVKNNLIHII